MYCPQRFRAYANAIFWDKTRLDPSEDFLARMSSFFQAGTFDEDFQNNPDIVLEKNLFEN